MGKELYDPCGGKPKAGSLLRKARRKNDSFTQIERDNGSLELGKHAIDEQLRTAMTAIATGLNMGDWDCVAEGLAMVQDVEALTRE